MPKVFAYEELEEDDPLLNDEEGNIFESAPASAFQYLAPPEFTGNKKPVYVKLSGDAPAPKPKPGFWEKLFPGSSSKSQSAHAQAYEALIVDFTAKMIGLGVVKVVCRYDGGNDEGFAWFSHAILKDGRELKQDDLVQALGGGKEIGQIVEWEAPSFWACALLGDGFGTGGYVMYGAFSVDLQTGLVADDPNPAPITKNITIRPD